MFKQGDIVCLDKRGIIDDEIYDYTFDLSKNMPFSISDIRENYITVRLHGVWIHHKHFKLWDVSSGFIQGDKYFKIGDKVQLECRGKIGWEQDDYTIMDNLLEDKIYTVCKYFIDFNGNKFIDIEGDQIWSYHPNHFKKVEDGI